MIEYGQLRDFDIFFYYGSIALETETQSDVLQNVVQPKRSLFYSRSQNSSGVNEWENKPVSFFLQMRLAYDIVTSLGKRNQVVSNGSDGLPDRRIACSQNTVRVDVDINGEVNVTVQYIPLANLKQTELSKVPLGLGGGG